MTALPAPLRPSPSSARGRRPRPGHGVAAPLPHPAAEAARLRRLLEVQRAANSALPLPDVLHLLVDTACELTAARHASLGVLGERERLDLVVSGGMPTDPGDATTSLLTVPIAVRGDLLGEISLEGSAVGRFTADDEEIVAALAETAGTAIATARTREQSRRIHDWMRASHEITRALLAEADVDLVLEVVSQALEAADADQGVLALPDRDGVLRATVVVGVGAERIRGWTFCPQASQLAALMTAGTPVLRDSLDGIVNPAFVNEENFGPLMSAPLVDAKGVRGSMLLLRTADRAPFTESEIGHLTSFADQVALALDMNDARDDAERLRVLEVRHQIAKDLHDNVIQRLFATGMGLHSIAATSLPEPFGDRLTRYVGELDDTIDEVRERVFGLQEESRHDSRGSTRFPRVRTSAPTPMPWLRAPSPRPSG